MSVACGCNPAQIASDSLVVSEATHKVQPSSGPGFPTLINRPVRSRPGRQWPHQREPTPVSARWHLEPWLPGPRTEPRGPALNQTHDGIGKPGRDPAQRGGRVSSRDGKRGDTLTSSSFPPSTPSAAQCPSSTGRDGSTMPQLADWRSSLYSGRQDC